MAKMATLVIIKPTINVVEAMVLTAKTIIAPHKSRRIANQLQVLSTVSNGKRTWMLTVDWPLSRTMRDSRGQYNIYSPVRTSESLHSYG
jgi:hypothetical protein